MFLVWASSDPDDHSRDPFPFQCDSVGLYAVVGPSSNTVLRVPPAGCALATALPGSYDYVDPRPQVGEPRRIVDTTRLVGWDGPTPKELLRTARGGERIAKGQRLPIGGRGGSRRRVVGSRNEGDL